MKSSRLVPYRGNLLNARLDYKRAKKKAVRRFQRRLLKYWNLKDNLVLWDKWDGYKNEKARKVLGIQKDFLSSTKNLTWFGVKLSPLADVDKVINLPFEHKENLRNKCLSIFKKYGKTVKVKFSDSKSYDYLIYKNGIETSFDNEEDEELAVLLYRRLIMYMVDNDSTDTTDKWSDVNPNEVDFFNGGSGSKLKYFKYTFTNEDILKVVNDRLFTKRTYQTVQSGLGGDDGYSEYQIKTIDTELFNTLLDDSLESIIVDSSIWSMDDLGKYTLNYDVVRNLSPEEFLIFIQTHLDTFSKVKKKWYQSGLFGLIVVIVVVVIATLTQQWWLVQFGVKFGTLLVYAGMFLSVMGALLKNEVMVMGGQIVSLVGAGVSLANTIASQQAIISQTTRELARAGLEQTTLQTAISSLENELLLKTMLSTVQFGNDIHNFLSSNGDYEMESEINKTPAEKHTEIFVAENEQFDGINRMFPAVVINSTIRTL